MNTKNLPHPEFSRLYKDYMVSADWAKKKAEVKALHNWTCQRCHRKSRQLTVHHRHYKTFMEEDPEKDLMLLCRRCHEKIHNRKFNYDND